MWLKGREGGGYKKLACKQTNQNCILWRLFTVCLLLEELVCLCVCFVIRRVRISGLGVRTKSRCVTLYTLFSFISGGGGVIVFVFKFDEQEFECRGCLHVHISVFLSFCVPNMNS